MSSDESAKYYLLLDEARRKYARIDQTCKDIKNRMLLFLTLGVAILTYFFSDIRECLPKELYGIIFFSIGITAVLASVGILLAHYRAIHNWPMPIGPIELEKINNLKYEKEILEVAVNDYNAAYDEACRITGKYARAANLALFLFVVGVIILLIVKFF